MKGGAGCSACHNGALFSDGDYHVVAFPQIGHGKGDADALGGDTDDWGRARETGENTDRYRFRTPSLLNIATTAPYGHAGSYESLNDVLSHYNNPRGAIEDYFANNTLCQLDQFAAIENCQNLYPASESNSLSALDQLARERNNGTSRFANAGLNREERQAMIAFLNALTDPCVENDACMAPWVARTEDDHDDQLLEAIDQEGRAL
ncbi:cytochrome-c peroxidase [Marinibactrum halimedae]|uniref:Cytochrome c domain-containing protein n=1 Tax=Marinibactrum halimedae TaxID=1444977 RepID=A0AA37T1M9_9GAMM|nr:hypothetical protein [Marinibactrum halimedae]MCD9461104.1 hypothetical protein [Marinibactrum halimedae]GLS24444.1 hypothetical protein GCM10007877_01550 [Marinibactrum halimedae]